jgi:predicted small lipoprotein YifL
MMKTAILGSLLALAISMVIGCGMKGELVLPNEPESQDRARFPEVLIPTTPSNAPAKR